MQTNSRTVNNKKHRHAPRRFTFSEPTPTAELETLKSSLSGIQSNDNVQEWDGVKDPSHLKKTQSLPTVVVKVEANRQDQVLGQSGSQIRTPLRKKIPSNKTPKSASNVALSAAAPRWAAGAFANSPPPSSLPIPAFDFDDIVDSEPASQAQSFMDTLVANQVPETSPSSSPPALSMQPLNQSPQLIRNSPPAARINKNEPVTPVHVNHAKLHSPSPRRVTHPISLSSSQSMPNLHGMLSSSPPLNRIDLDTNNNVLAQPVVMSISPPPYGYYVHQPGQHSPPASFGGNNDLEQISSDLRRMLNISAVATK